jgi:tetratricopeptide (TPR) repeat protein
MLHLNPHRKAVESMQRLSRLVADGNDRQGLALILQTFLEHKPMAIEARGMLRRLQIEAYEGAHSGLHLLADGWQQIRLPLLHGKAEEAFTRDPQEAMQLAEQILAVNPFDEMGNRLLARIGDKLRVPKLSVLAWETMCARKTEDAEALVALGEAYLADKDFEDAEDSFHEALELDGGNVAAQRGLHAVAEARESYRPPAWTPEESGGAPEVEGRQLAPHFEPRPLRTDLKPLLEPVASLPALVNVVCDTLDPLEDQAAFRLSVLAEWQHWVEEGLQPYRADLARACEDETADPWSLLRLGLLEVAFLNLPAARQAFDRVSRQPEHADLGWGLAVVCLAHEEILVRPIAGPSLADFAWIV